MDLNSKPPSVSHFSSVERKIERPENELRPMTFYQEELKKHLPESVFERTPWRALYFVSFLGINITLITAVVTLDPAWYLKLLAGFVIGQLNASLAFFAHESLHGSIFKNRFLQDLTASIGLAPFLVSATYWRFWHNNLHHRNTQFIHKDPDVFPTLFVYKKSKFLRFVFNLSPGSNSPLSYFYFFYWFTVQSVLIQSYLRFKLEMWANMNHKRVTMEFIPMCLAAVIYVYWVGSANFLWLVLIPFLVQNYTILSYISTNHNLSPLTKINDPLENSLTVTSNRFWDFIHLNFGYHVEHHLFPGVSYKHAKTIHKLLIELYPTKYKHMPKSKALRYLYQTPRIYKNSTELIHPKTMKNYPTI